MNYTPGDAENKYILAITKSYAALENYIQANYPEFEIVKCTTTEECMELLNSGECDFMAQNVNVVTPLLQKPRYEGLTVLPNLSKEEPMGIVGKNSDENKILMSIINKCITQISSQEVSQITISIQWRMGISLPGRMCCISSAIRLLSSLFCWWRVFCL